MDIHNFQLGSVFHQNAKEYITRPVKAAKYQSGMENSWMVYFSNMINNGSAAITYEGVRFFPTESEAWDYINANEEQLVKENGKLISVKVTYDPPKPVLCRKDADAINKDGLHFCFGEKAFASDESCDYEFYILECGCWIIQDMGNIRVWYPDSEETFFGKENDIVYEKAGNDEYIKVAV